MNKKASSKPKLLRNLRTKRHRVNPSGREICEQNYLKKSVDEVQHIQQSEKNEIKLEAQ